MNQRALGMLPGASDLMFFLNGRFVAIEIKLPGSKHDKAHVERQLRFGENVKINGGEYYIIKSVEAFLTVINKSGSNPEILDVWTLKELIEVSKTKVKF